jgi:DNA-directed RNA polymerase subunit N (RpoN/RPB10)
MKANIEYVYRCMRCGKEIRAVHTNSLLVVNKDGEVNKVVDSLTGNESYLHYCDESKGQVGQVELVGMNVGK